MYLLANFYFTVKDLFSILSLRKIGRVKAKATATVIINDLTGLNIFSQASHDGRHARIQAQCLFDATFQVSEVGHVLRGARSARVGKHLVQFFKYFLLCQSIDVNLVPRSQIVIQYLLFRMLGDAVKEPNERAGRCIVPLSR